jgi:hypothetical protein
MIADYFTVGCRSEKGMVVLCIERGPGVETKQIKTSYSSTAGKSLDLIDRLCNSLWSRFMVVAQPV